MTLPFTHAELKERLKKLQEEQAVIDMERGYCRIVNPPYEPKVSDYWAQECYKRMEPELDKFLADYASLLLESGTIIEVGPLPKLVEWREMLRFARRCSDLVLRGKCIMLAEVYLAPAIDGDKRIPYDKLAEMIANKLSDYPYNVYSDEAVCDGYDGNFDEYYTRKREEIDLWDANLTTF